MDYLIFKVTGFPKHKGMGWPAILFAARDGDDARQVVQQLLGLTQVELEAASITPA